MARWLRLAACSNCRGGRGGRKILLLKACIVGEMPHIFIMHWSLTNHFMRDFEKEPSVGPTKSCYYCWFRTRDDNFAIWPQ